MNRIIDLPNPFESAPEAGRPAAAAFVPQPGAAAVGASSPEVRATSAPGMARSDSLSSLVECVTAVTVVDAPPSADALGDDSAAALDIPGVPATQSRQHVSFSISLNRKEQNHVVFICP